MFSLQRVRDVVTGKKSWECVDLGIHCNRWMQVEAIDSQPGFY